MSGFINYLKQAFFGGQQIGHFRIDPNINTIEQGNGPEYIYGGSNLSSGKLTIINYEHPTDYEKPLYSPINKNGHKVWVK